ncbi:MAG TPA: NFACT family protein [Pyrinomonadaceae bacterium]|jgi:predicted ribosome quality control (RQC) complex YloA/Tae2 family protein
MNDPTIKAIVEELAPLLTGRMPGRIFQLARMALALDFRPGDGRYLFISVEPARPRIHLIERRVRELEKQSVAPSPFALVLRKQLGGATLGSIAKDDRDRIVRLSFDGQDEVGNPTARTLVVQLTGKASNLLLLDGSGRVLDTLRPPRGEGQEIGDLYRPPAPQAAGAPEQALFERGRFSTYSEALDDYYRGREAAQVFDARAAAALAQLRKELAQHERLRRHLERDLAEHGDAAEHKRIGDLLLANIGTARRDGPIVTLTDYYAEDAPTIELELDENSTLQEEAARSFARYTKARRAAQEIAQRLVILQKEIEALEARRAELEAITERRDEAALEGFDGKPQTEAGRPQRKKKPAENIAGVRRYRSSDGYEILVGRAARDNDQLTFRIARPHDLWLHAADYAGSHVIVRNPTRTDIPHRTIIEAAQLAAAFSRARRDAKVDVHYTPRKLISKPRGAVPGLVRMSGFRSITVEPREGVERI